MRKLPYAKTMLATAMSLGLGVAGLAQTSSTTTTTSSQESSNSSTTMDAGQGATYSTNTRHVQKTNMTSTGMLSGGDQSFVQKAGDGNLTEVQLAQMALNKSSNDQVRDFARKIQQDHTQANQQLNQIATDRGMTLPSSPVMPDDQNMISRLSNLSGPDFDRAYMRMMVRDHRKDIREFERESQDGTDSAVKGFASSTLPTLRTHLQMAESIANNLGVKTAGMDYHHMTGTRSRTVVQTDKGTINEVTPAPGSTVVETDKTTVNEVTPAPGSTVVERTTINEVTPAPGDTAYSNGPVKTYVKKNGTIVQTDKSTINKIVPPKHVQTTSETTTDNTVNSDGSTSTTDTTVTDTKSK